MHAVALAARELADRLLLVGAAEVEPAHVLARVHLAAAELDRVGAAAHLLPDAAARVERGPRLVDVGELDRVAEPDRAGVGLLLARDEAKQRRLAGAVGTDHTHDAGRRQ